MGMFDREPNFEDTFTVGDRFVITALRPAGEVHTVHGPAKKVYVTIVTRESYQNASDRQTTYSALGAGFAAMAERAAPTDFPVVVEYTKRPTPLGSVKRFERVDIAPGEWVKGDDGPPLPPVNGPADAGVGNGDAVTGDLGF